jgi:hypothetical protein
MEKRSGSGGVSIAKKTKGESAEKSLWFQCPAEVRRLILGLLPWRDLIPLRLISKEFKKTIEEDGPWRTQAVKIGQDFATSDPVNGWYSLFVETMKKEAENEEKFSALILCSIPKYAYNFFWIDKSEIKQKNPRNFYKKHDVPFPSSNEIILLDYALLRLVKGSRPVSDAAPKPEELMNYVPWKQAPLNYLDEILSPDGYNLDRSTEYINLLFGGANPSMLSAMDEQYEQDCNVLKGCIRTFVHKPCNMYYCFHPIRADHRNCAFAVVDPTKILLLFFNYLSKF